MYSLATVGFTLKQFYCCGKLKSVAVAITGDEKADHNKGSVKSNCCDSKFEFIKVNDKHLTGDNVNITSKSFYDLAVSAPLYQSSTITLGKVMVANRSNAPPFRSAVPIYLYNCVFRI